MKKSVTRNKLKRCIGLLFVAILLKSFSLNAQVENVIHTGEHIYIGNTIPDVYIMGSFETRADVISNRGIIHIQGDLINNGPSNVFGDFSTGTSEGAVRFFGGTPLANARITGNTVNLNSLIVDLDNPALSGNVLLRTKTLNIFGNIDFVQGGFDIDTNTINIQYYSGTPYLGIIKESNTARILQLNNNNIGKISLLNYPWNIGTYNNIFGIGIGLTISEPLGGNPVLTRTFFPYSCGDSTGHIGSIERVYRMENNTYNSIFRNPRIDFLSAELAGNPYGDSLNIFVSKDKGQSWRQVQHNVLSNDTLCISNGLSMFAIPQNYTVITAATDPCDNLTPIQVNQIITNINPNDTLENVSSILVCDTNNVNARLFATGEYGAYFEWRRNSGNYIPQDVGYYDINSIGTYWVRMTTVRGCTDSVSVNALKANDPDPAISASDNHICLGESVFFKPQTFEPTSQYEWDFGDGNTSTDDSLYYTFTNIGSFMVKLKVTSVNHCMSQSTTTIDVYQIPVASFTYSNACPGDTVFFTNNSSVYPATMMTLSWNFGLGTSTINYNSSIPSSGNTFFVFPDDSTYTVTLTAEANQCTSTVATQTISIYPKPTAAFTTSPACEGQSISFINNSTISDSSALTYVWDFNYGTGPYSSNENTFYTYSHAGTYTAGLTVTSLHGCSDSDTSTVTVNKNPIAGFNYSNVCVNDTAVFTDITTAGTQPYSYQWDFGDSFTDSAGVVFHEYNSPGSYIVTLFVTTQDNCTGTATNSITIYPKPSVSFSVMNNCVDLPINFINTSSNATSYLWNFPDLATTSTTQNPTVTYNNAGTFSVFLSAVSQHGCVSTDTGQVTIYPEPALILQDTIRTCGSTYTLYADTSSAGNSYIWSTGAFTQQYTVTYNGNFSVTVTSPFGCISNGNSEVILNADVIPVLGPDNVFCDSTQLDAGYTSPSTTYIWSTGETTEEISVSSTNTYSVTVIDQNGCVGSDTINVTIVPSTPVNLGPDTVVCESEALVLDAGIGAGYLWNNGSSSQTLDVESSGYYWVNVINGAGCNSSDTIYVTVNTSPALSLGSDKIACDEQLLYNDQITPPAHSYQWSTGETTNTINVYSSGEYIVTLTNTATTCSSFDTVNVTINTSPVVELGNDTILCSYNSVTLDAANSGYSFQWNSGQTTQTITVSSNGLYDVVVTDNNNCTGTDNISVFIRPVFVIDLGPEKTYCPGSTLILDAGLTTTGNSFTWENTSSVLGTSETYSVSDTGMYFLTVIDSYNCIARDSVRVYPSNTSLYAVFLSDSRITTGDTVMFVNLSYPNPFESKWYLDDILISNDSCPVVAFTMPVSYPYEVIYARLNISNEFCTSTLTKPIIVSPSVIPATTIDSKPEVHEAEPVKPLISMFKLYPNPNGGTFNLYVEVSDDIPADIKIFSITGVMLYNETRILNNSVFTYSFNDIKPGMYFLTVETEFERHTIKFLKTPE